MATRTGIDISHAIPDGSTADGDSPATPNAAYKAQRPLWTLVDDVLEGTTAIRRAGEKYTPRAQGEEDDDFKRRLNRSRFYNIYRRTLAGLVGRVFRRPPKLAKDTDPRLLGMAENIDGRGTHHSVFLRRLMTKGLHHGHVAIFVDAPPDQTATLGRRPTIRDERTLGQRPYWVMVTADQILNYRTAIVNGHEVLDQVTLEEVTQEATGTFGEAEVTRYRVLRRNNGVPTWHVYRKQEQGDPMLETEGSFARVTEIPLIPYYAGEPEDWFKTRPTLYDLAETNLDHYAVQSGHRHALHVASFPIPVVIGLSGDAESVSWSVTTGLKLDPGGNAFYMEHTGASIGQTRTEMHDLEDRMAMLGLQAMARKTRQAETAEAKRIDQLEQESTLAVAARGLQDADEQAWLVTAQMLGLPAPSITINFDFDGLSLSPDEIRVYLDMWKEQAITRDVFWDLMEQGCRLPEDFDRDQVADQLEQEAMALVPRPDPDDDPDPPPAVEAEPLRAVA